VALGSDGGIGHPAGTADPVPIRDQGGVHVAVEAPAEDGPADPMGLPWGGGNRVRHLETRVGLLWCPSRQTLASHGNGHDWGGSLPSQGQQG
jgi:hypothetical protein